MADRAQFIPTAAELVLAHVDRVEVIDSRGRVFVQRYSSASVTVQVQDEGRTLKVFAGYPTTETEEQK